MNSQTKTNKRILALDILRGVTIAGMIMVNNPGTWGYIYPQVPGLFTIIMPAMVTPRRMSRARMRLFVLV